MSHSAGGSPRSLPQPLTLSPQERAGLRDFFECYRAHYEPITQALIERLRDDPGFNPVTPQAALEPSGAGQLTNLELLTRAIRQDDWPPYLDYLTTQGQVDAQSGLSFQNLVHRLGAFRLAALPYLLADYAHDPARLTAVLIGLQALGDRMVAAVGQGYLTTQTALIQAQAETLRTVAERRPATPAARPATGELYRDQLQTLTDALAAKVTELQVQIAERKLAETTARVSEERLKTTLDAMLEGVLMIGFDWRYVYLNEAAVALSRKPRDEMLGHTLMEVFPGAENTLLFAKLRESMQQRTTQHFETDFVFPDGSKSWFQLSIQPAPEGLFVLARDISENKRAEEQLRYQAAVLEHVNDAVVAFDSQSRITAWNPAAEALFGYRFNEVVGRPYRNIVAAEDQDAADDTIGLALFTAGRWQGELRARRRGGDLLYLLVSAAALKDAAGQVTGFTAVMHDITERRRAEEALAASEASLRSLFAAMTDVVLVLDREGRYLQIAPTNPAKLLRPPAELLGRTIYDVMPAQEAEIIHGYIRRVLTEQQPIQTDYSLVIGDTMTWFAASIAPKGSDQVIWIARDITSRIQRERELQAIAAVSTALRTVNTQADILPIILDQVTALVDANATAIGLVDPATGDLVATLGRGALASMVGQRVPPGAGIAGQVIATGKPFISADASAEKQAYLLDWVKTAPAVACLPLTVSQRAFGTLWAGRAAPFSEIEVRVLGAIADLAAGALQRARLHELMESQLRRLAALRQIDQAIMNSLDLQTTLMFILSQLVAQLHVDASDILVLNRSLNLLEYTASRGFNSTAMERSHLRLGEGYAGRAALERRRIQVADLRLAREQFLRARLLADEHFVALICLPLMVKGQVVGVVEVWQRGPLSPDADWLAYLETLAGQAAIAIADARLSGDLQRSNQEMRLAYDTALEGWSAALDLRDKDGEGHTQRVTDLTVQLARAMGLSNLDLEHIRRGALLHDIGKMGLPDAILLKPGPLTDDEWASMRQHPQLAYDLLSRIAFLRPALDIPYCHHEWWDGTGYPRQLKGEAIPLSARIFAVVDVWDTLLSNRPYRAAWPKDKVRAHLQEQAGTHFDPQVVRAFLALPSIR